MIWELYNLASDRSESHNKAPEYPLLVMQLSNGWQSWAEKNHVLPLDSSGGERSKRYNQR